MRVIRRAAHVDVQIPRAQFNVLVADHVPYFNLAGSNAHPQSRALRHLNRNRHIARRPARNPQPAKISRALEARPDIGRIAATLSTCAHADLAVITALDMDLALPEARNRQPQNRREQQNRTAHSYTSTVSNRYEPSAGEVQEKCGLLSAPIGVVQRI